MNEICGLHSKQFNGFWHIAPNKKLRIMRALKPPAYKSAGEKLNPTLTLPATRPAWQGRELISL